MRFDHTHTSSRFSVKPAVFEHWLDEYMANADLLTVTEVDNNARARMLREPGWGAVWGDKGPRDDCGIAWRKSKFTRLFAETYTLTDARYTGERGQKVDTTEGAFAVLESSSGDRMVVGVGHLPHGMQEELRKDKIRSDVARAYVRISRAFKKRGRQLVRKFKAKALLLVADWNLNIKLLWVRSWFKTFAPNLRVNWKQPFPAQGTHGKSIIDIALYYGMVLVRGPNLLPHDPSSDHTAWTESFAL